MELDGAVSHRFAHLCISQPILPMYGLFICTLIPFNSSASIKFTISDLLLTHTYIRIHTHAHINKFTYSLTHSRTHILSLSLCLSVSHLLWR